MASLSGAAARPETTVVVAVKNAPSSRRAATWASEHLGPICQRILLVHVIPRVSFIPSPLGEMIPVEKMEKEVVQMYTEDATKNAQEVFAPFNRLFGRKLVETLVLEGDNIAATLVKYVFESGMQNLVLGASSHKCLKRILNHSDVAANVLRLMTNHCNIIIVSREKLTLKFSNLNTPNGSENTTETQSITQKAFCESERNWIFREQFLRGFLCSCPETLPSLNDTSSFGQSQSFRRSQLQEARSFRNTGYKPEPQQEILRLRADLQKTLMMYNHACEDLAHARKMIEKLSNECSEASKKVQDALQRESEIKKLIEMDYKKRSISSISGSEKSNDINALLSSAKSCKRYSKEEIENATDNFSDLKKIGEGSYGNVYKCVLDDFEVAIKVLRQESNEKNAEFLREVEILSQLNHPNMLSLLGFCPENGSLIYEYMQNGSLDDHLFSKNDDSAPLTWETRFKIIHEVSLGLAFLHNTKPDPIVHRDLKPANILLDSNFKSKIGDVGLAKLINEVVPDGLTEYRETILAGTIYYMDPEYHRTGTVRPKSDLYALGVIMLQMLTGRHPNGLLVRVEKAVESGLITDLLDVSVPDWPVREAEKLARLALRCCRLRCRDRPDLEKEVLPQVEDVLTSARVAGFGCVRECVVVPPKHFVCPILKEIMENPYIAGDGYSYEHKAIKAWLEKSDYSPITRHKLKYTSIIPNHSLRSAIEEWKSSVQNL